MYSSAARLLSLPKPAYQLFTSPLCLAITFYFATKKYGEAKAKQYIGILCNNIGITLCGPAETAKAISNKKVVDLEDGLEYYSAIHEGCHCIITEDAHDFYFSEISVLNCYNFLLQHFSK